jgi:hypothetical protein
LERNSSFAILCSGKRIRSVFYSVEDCACGFSCRLAVGDGDDQDGFAELVGASALYDEGFDDFSPELGTHWCEAFEFDLGDQSFDFLFRADIISLNVRIHKADFDPIGIEEASCVGGLGDD